MRRFHISLFLLPLYLAGAVLLAVFLCVSAGAAPPPRPLTEALCAAGLLALLIFRAEFKAVEAIVDTFEQQDPALQSLSFLGKLRMLQKETSVSRRREMSTAQADTQAEIDALQSQINPHFLYNTLDSIRGQALIDHSPVIADMTEALSVLFRYSIGRTGNLVTLREEVQCIEKYLMIQRFRFSGKFQYEKQLDETLLSCLIPRLTLQPIVENAIYHGLETREEGGVISLQIENCGQYFVIHVKDNGVGISEAQLLEIHEKLHANPLGLTSLKGKKGNGIALGNVHRRIRLSFGNHYGLVVSSSPGLGTDVEIVLPVLTARDSQAAV